jgi:hypothetical protein
MHVEVAHQRTIGVPIEQDHEADADDQQGDHDGRGSTAGQSQAQGAGLHDGPRGTM